MGSYLDKLLLGVKQVYRNGTPLPLRPVINFVNLYQILDNPALDATDVYVSTTGGVTLIVEHNAAPVTVRPILNFIGGTVADNVGNNSTDVTLGSIVENGGATITQRPVLNLIGFGYADNPGNSSMDFTTPSALVGPGAVITGNTTIAANKTFSVIGDGPYTIDMRNVVAGREYLFLARGTGTLGAGVTFSQGTASFLIEDPETSGSGFTTGATVNVHTDWTTYGFALDTTANLLRSTR